MSEIDEDNDSKLDIAKSKDEIESNNYKLDKWNPWTDKSQDISFKSNKSGVGDGEAKLGAEYDTAPNGQNSSHDLNIFDEKWECKKLDSDNSFRLGVEVSAEYTQTLMNVLRILEIIKSIIHKLINETKIKKDLQNIVSKINETSKKCKTSLMNGLLKNEVSSSNLEKANDIIEYIREIVHKDLPSEIELFSPYSGQKKKYTSVNALNMLIIENIQKKEIIKKLGGNDVYNKSLLCAKLEEYLEQFKKQSLKDKLNAIVREVFKEKRLVLVDEKKGYYPVSNYDKILCNRITSGAPRCKIFL
jgi:hypothetical protein